MKKIASMMLCSFVLYAMEEGPAQNTDEQLRKEIQADFENLEKTDQSPNGQQKCINFIKNLIYPFNLKMPVLKFENYR